MSRKTIIAIVVVVIAIIAVWQLVKYYQRKFAQQHITRPPVTDVTVIPDNEVEIIPPLYVSDQPDRNEEQRNEQLPGEGWITGQWDMYFY